ncbi:MAG: hypothetical protein HQ509_04360 [Candidatus Marinimicrobia bacterium]|nr:hypothetical protein [Candidatus Neomarinimicrobiota bacterium]
MRKVTILLLILVPLLVVSCTTHTHMVGTGPQSGQVETATQWFALFGLIPINTVDTNTMAGGAANYEIKTSTEALDIIVGIPASYITVSRRTVTVTK